MPTKGGKNACMIIKGPAGLCLSLKKKGGDPLFLYSVVPISLYTVCLKELLAAKCALDTL